MREIKFRAYNKKTKEMRRVMRLYIFDGYAESTTDLCVEVVNSGKWLLSDVELMQYTGIKSLAGEEIYEGDIIKYDATDFNKNCISLIKDLETAFDADELAYILRMKKTIEVIGNIYEDPDLLKI